MMTTTKNLSPEDLATLDSAKWLQRPHDAGQMVDVHWCAVGEAGAIRRTVDRSAGSTTYTLHRWRDDAGERGYEPWNGVVEVWRRGRRLSPAEAAELIREEWQW